MSEKRKILAVDDEPRNLKIFSLSLGNEWTIQTAADGEEALRSLTDSIPDVVLLDIMIPGIDGYKVCEAIKADPRCKFTKVILVSGKAMIEERLKGYEVGADDYLAKPFSPEELQAKVRVFMRLLTTEKELSQLNLSLEEKVKTRTEQLLNAEARLVNSAKMSALGEMAGGIAHEINTPLTAISIISEQLLEMVQNNTFEKTKAEKCLKSVGIIIIKISKIIQSLRMFSRDSMQDPFNNYSLKEIITDTLSLCEERILKSGVKLDLDLPKEDIIAKCRPSQLSQVILNLVNNSFHSVSKNTGQKWILISAAVIDGSIRLSVTDNGHGVPVEIRDKIFQPFFTTKEIGQGTGLGLSIAKGIAESHGGTITLDVADKNTSFILKLPKAA